MLSFNACFKIFKIKFFLKRVFNVFFYSLVNVFNVYDVYQSFVTLKIL